MAGGLIKEGIDQVSTKQVCRVMLHISAEKLGKNQPHDQQRQHRREHTPCHPKHGALVLLFEVPFGKFFKQELILP